MDAKLAGTIARGLYISKNNWEHCQKWLEKNADTLEGTEMYRRIMAVKYGSSAVNYTGETIAMRQRLTELGYVPLESSRSN